MHPIAFGSYSLRGLVGPMLLCAWCWW